MSKIKLIALDLDGTLLMEDHSTVSKRNLSALKAASDLGIKIAISTGRTYKVLSGILKQVTCATHAVMANGATAMELATEKFLFSDGIKEEIWAPIYKELISEDAAFEVYFKGQSLIERDRLNSFRSPTAPEDYALDLRQYITPVDGLFEYLSGNQIEKIHVLSVPDGKYERMYKKFSDDPSLKITCSMPGNFEINSSETNKGVGLEKLCALLGIERDCVMAFGDAGNDVEMLKWAGFSFAMENATNEAKAAAKYITASNLQDGVAQAVEKYVLSDA